MAMSLDSAGLLKAWSWFGGHAAGRLVFSRIVGKLIPYTGTMGAVVEEIDRGRSLVRLDDRRLVRNHLGSIHAVALANLGEFATGSAVLTATPAGGRAILKSLKAEYLKKARGTLRASASVEPMTTVEKKDLSVRAEIKNEAGEVVAVVEAVWLVGPIKKEGA